MLLPDDLNGSNILHVLLGIVFLFLYDLLTSWMNSKSKLDLFASVMAAVKRPSFFQVFHCKFLMFIVCWFGFDVDFIYFEVS